MIVWIPVGYAVEETLLHNVGNAGLAVLFSVSMRPTFSLFIGYFYRHTFTDLYSLIYLSFFDHGIQVFRYRCTWGPPLKIPCERVPYSSKRPLSLFVMTLAAAPSTPWVKPTYRYTQGMLTSIIVSSVLNVRLKSSGRSDVGTGHMILGR